MPDAAGAGAGEVPQSEAAAPKPEVSVVLLRVKAAKGLGFCAGAWSRNSALLPLVLFSSGSSEAAVSLVWSTALRPPNHDESAKREVLGDATALPGNGLASVVSRRLVPGLDAVEGEDTPKLPLPWEIEVFRPFGTVVFWLPSLFCCCGIFNGEFTSVA
jgi:hypothetical protein